MFKGVLNGIAVTAISISIMLAATGCGGAKDKTAEMGPVETVETFYSSLIAGDISTVNAICDSLAMKEYIEAYSEAWNKLREKDSTVAGITAGILASAQIEVTESVKEGDKRIIEYNISIGKDVKGKTAVVRKDEGVWKIERISDRN